MFSMSGSTVVPALITGVVGVVGVGGAVWSARLSVKSVSERDRLAEKRRIYADVYSTYTALHQQLYRFKYAVKSNWGDQEREDSLERLNEAKDAVIRATSEFALIAPAEPLREALKTYQPFMNRIEDYSHGKTDASLNDLNDLQISLLRAMRKDLEA
jgi:hypothetical protein